MLIGVPREIKNHEYRVGLTPEAVLELAQRGHKVLVESGAGGGIGVTDGDYVQAGAAIAADAKSLFAEAEMIVKVKEPQPQECAMLRPGQILFTYLHLAAEPEIARALQKSGAVCIAYETVTDAAGRLPLLAPMSEVAGRMAVQAGAHYLEKAHGGRGVLLSGVPGTSRGKVMILGGGTVGANAAQVACGMGAEVTVFDRSLPRLRELDLAFGGALNTHYATTGAIEKALRRADLVIGAVLVPGAAAPRLVTRAALKTMQQGAVMVDVAIDQGGCFETSRPTTHAEPVYAVDGVIHYCVTNMPGAVPRTSTFALTHATLPYVITLADRGWREAMSGDPGFGLGLNVAEGKIMHPAVAAALG
ncbi:MAG: alanine dehydrogenase [Alphaproteobacteria bacterium]